MKHAATYFSEAELLQALMEMQGRGAPTQGGRGISLADTTDTPKTAPTSPGRSIVGTERLACLLKEIVAADYQPRFDSASVGTESKVLRRISRWLHYEFRNRLAEPAAHQTSEAIGRIAALDICELKSKSRIELRSAIECILRDVGFPPLSEEFAHHNARVNLRCIDKVNGLRSTSRQASTAQWLLLLAVANKFEVWPGESSDIAAECFPTNWSECRAVSGAFSGLGERARRQVLTSGIVGLFADNHGEIAVDLAFLEWLQQQNGCKVVLFAKESPVETDVDVEQVRQMIRQHFPSLKATVVSTGSRVQGTLLTSLSLHAADALSQIAAKHGFVVVKGLANLETVPGLLIDGMFLFTVKTAQVASLFDVPLDAGAGLWLRPGNRLRNCGDLLAVADPVHQRDE